MKKFLLTFFLFLAFLLLPNVAYSAEQEKAGYVLTEESMVFPLEEAQNLQVYISKLEQEIETKSEIISNHKLLVENKNEQIKTFEEYLELKNAELKIYKDLKNTYERQIKKMENKNNLKKLEVIGAFAGGAILTTTLLILADQIDDQVIE